MLPAIPTDNLFKFLAIGGIILAGASVWVIQDQEDRLRTSEIAAREQYIEFVTEMETRMNILASQVKTKEPLTVKLAIPDTDGKLVQIRPGTKFPLLGDAKWRDQYREVLTFWDNWLASSSTGASKASPEVGTAFPPDAVKELRTKLRQHSTTVENLWRQAATTKGNCNFAFMGILLGVVGSVFGFIFWRIAQRRLDTLEKLKLQKEQKELEEKKAAVGQP
ncbi:MAG: hypothetical protein K8U57_30605 [Planctomycetes bacterium]|nr:hypothetical protein [Planctomycetota bacterium]